RDRGGDGTAICTDVWFEDDTGRRVTTVLSGRPLRVALRYELRRPSSRFEFRIGFYDRGGTCIAHNSTEYAPLPQASLPGSGVISCTVPRLPLPAGQYYVNTSIVRDGSIGADRVERAAAFTVEPGDFYRSGKIPPASYGKTLFDYTWNLRAADRDIAA
ncbi:MAG: Wzt carbohydrate-binding domain-containing protein, partial [Planctomycetaceae bacterium]